MSVAGGEACFRSFTIISGKEVIWMGLKVSGMVCGCEKRGGICLIRLAGAKDIFLCNAALQGQRFHRRWLWCFPAAPPLWPLRLSHYSSHLSCKHDTMMITSMSAKKYVTPTLSVDTDESFVCRSLLGIVFAGHICNARRANLWLP